MGSSRRSFIKNFMRSLESHTYAIKEIDYLNIKAGNSLKEITTQDLMNSFVYKEKKSIWNPHNFDLELTLDLKKLILVHIVFRFKLIIQQN